MELARLVAVIVKNMRGTVVPVGTVVITMVLIGESDNMSSQSIFPLVIIYIGNFIRLKQDVRKVYRIKM